jgi:peptide/nickel transport system substrate-binding protein
VTYQGRWPRWQRFLLLPGLVLGLVACGTDSASGAGKTTVTYVGVRGGTISLGISQSPTGCNPHTLLGNTPATRMLLGAVLPSPFTISPGGNPTPNPNLIVQSELVSTKPQTIVYTLNPKAIWSDRIPITAADFVYAWEQQRGDVTSDPTTVATTAGYRDISSVKGSNKGKTVTVVFKTQFADWQMLFGNLLPAHIMEKVGWDPACSSVDPAIDLSGGPFAISSVTPQSITLTLNHHWWGVPPNSKSIVVRIAQSADQLAQWLRSGVVQVAQPSALTPAFLSQVTSLPGVQSEVNLSGTILQFDMASGPNTRLSPDERFAISLFIDRQALVQRQADWALSSVQVASSHFFAQGQSGYHAQSTSTTTTIGPGSSLTPPSSTTSTVIGAGGKVNFPSRQELAQANQLMTASGQERTDGGPWHSVFGLPLVLHLVIDTGDPWATATAPQLVDQLTDAGFTVTTYNVASAAQAGSILANGFADLALIPRTTSPFLSQTLGWYTNAFGPPGQDGSQDWTGFDSSTFSQLLTTASQQLSLNVASTDYQMADQQLWSAVVSLPLYTEPTALAVSRKVGGVTATPSSDSFLWYGQFWAVKVPERSDKTTPTLPGP